ncbi:HlyD family efflux transporter periplasmic adaptor subunit [Hymenobacter sp. BT770]|uniref:efflux RND transporter periplasmic adaptor subunit n=1 Tax=Hymenobacter sp. BT770 TaxID=2886942 RepID=UPI001D10CB8E|nr:HlyD family efflux transporter periplasmic adaptor subunit [Hymenobacter sp. BT770]MCC3153635.1 HlyD family efflux transporter periplasmic adaptor subunit [Hymenobacter sp. BT770]MDO3415899.1 HlyD family efflux transporter periplasmic adaptor subunit [Hymenobacter sp. BT770]
MDRAIAPAIQSQRQRRRWLFGAGVVVALLVAVLAFRTVLKPSIRRTDILTATVENGDVEASLTAAGTIIPGREVVITSPIQSTISRVAVAVGARVKPGEAILELDKELTNSALAKLSDEQLRNQNKNSQLQLTLERSLNDLRAQAQVQAVKVRSLQSALRDEQQLLKIGGGTAENVRQAELNLTVAQLEAQRLARQIQTQQRSNAADVRELGYTVSMQQRSISELATKLRQANISSQQPGVLTWVNENIGTTVQAGDPLARVADLSSFRVRATISDTYADALHQGDPVVVRINGLDLRGTVTTISPSVEKGVVTFYAQLDNPHHPALRSNLRADVFVVTRAHHGVLRLKNGPYYQGGKEQPVFVIKDGRAVRRTVQFGDSNFDFVQITGGLRAGEEVVVSDMKAHLDTPELIVKD